MSGIGAPEICGIALICASLSMLLKCFGSRSAPIFVAVSLVGIAAFGISAFGEAFSQLEDYVELAQVGRYAEAVMKIVGTAFLCSICSDALSELGEGGIAKAANLAGRIEILLIAMPFFSEILKEAGEFLGAQSI